MFDFQLFLEAVFGWPLAEGAVLTIALSLAVMAVSMLTAMGTASLATSPQRLLRWSIIGYVWLLRGTPALLVLLFIWNGLPQLSPLFRAGWFSPFLAAFIALTLIQVAYLTEILRSAFAAVGPGQREAGAALGLHRGQIFVLITLPQAMRIALPALMSEFITLLKTTSLATVISLKELMTVTQYAIATSFRFMEWYGAALVYYLVMVSILTAIQMRTEALFARGRR